MNIPSKKVSQLVEEELAAANELYPPFASPHEGWAVILQEIMEMRDEMDKVSKHHDEMFRRIMHNASTLEEINELRYRALCAACEAIQIAAMAQKFRDMERSKEVDTTYLI